MLLSAREQEKLSIMEIRAGFNFFGFNLTDMTDQEIIFGINAAAKQFSQTGFTANEFVEAMNRLSLNPN